MKLLGITSMYHDSSACLMVDGEIIAYVEEERFNRKKHTSAHPQQAIDWVLSTQGLQLDDIDEVIYYFNPWGYLKTGIKMAIRNFPVSLFLANKQAASQPPFKRLQTMARLKSTLCHLHQAQRKFNLVFLDHYKTHQAAAFFASGLEESAILTMDVAVDGKTEVIAYGKNNQIQDIHASYMPNAFGNVYSSLTHLLGFKFHDEYKVMGMAAYGEPKYVERVEELFIVDEATGKLSLNFSYFAFQKYGMLKMYSERLTQLFWRRRQPDEPLTQRDYDLAASLQEATNRYGLKKAKAAKKLTGSKNLCLAGGVAQNCLMNQAICESGLFEKVFIQPLAGDVGCSLGAVLYRYHQVHQKPRQFTLKHLYLGPAFQQQETVTQPFLKSRHSENWTKTVAQAIAEGLVVGYFDGRMEAGPRALGARSILADPRRADMKDILNSRVKHREHFRPFAPSVLSEKVNEVFEPLPACLSLDFMIVTMTVKEEWRSKLPAITHHDNTARVQAVKKEYAPHYYEIIENFYQLTGVPLVINTSFNDNEPIVCTPEDAIACFRRTKIDLLVINGRLYFREDNIRMVEEVCESIS